MKRIDRAIWTYDVGDGFHVDIVSYPEKDMLLEAWIYHEDYGVKELMFGVEHEMLEDFEAMVEANVKQHVDTYKEEYII